MVDSPTPGCPGCDECCDDTEGTCNCKDCDCSAPDGEVVFTVLPFYLPVPHDHGGGGAFECCPATEAPLEALYVKSDNDPSFVIGSCIGGNNGCGDSGAPGGKTCKIINFRVCNKTTKCITVNSIFCISGLSKETNRETDCTSTGANPACPNEDADCCLLQYAGQGGNSVCDWQFASKEPNGVAPGPGFCIPPCSESVICVAFRVVAPSPQCGGKTYSDESERYACCCAEATISGFCFSVCCVDQASCEDESFPGAGDGCANAIDPGGVSETCPTCCECCKPDQPTIEGAGFTIITSGCFTSETCCENIVAELDVGSYFCCQNNPSCTTPADCDPFNFGFFFNCTNYDESFYSGAGPTFCELIPVDSGHPCYKDPCVCVGGGGGCGGDPGDDCFPDDGWVFEGSDLGGCPDTTGETTPALACSPDPGCTAVDTPNDPCEGCP